MPSAPSRGRTQQKLCSRKAPSTAVFLGTQWQNGSTTLLIEDKPAVWLRQQVTGSLLQGGHDGHPTFCITLWHHIQRALGPLADGPIIRLWLYVDDIVLQASPTAWPDLWQSMTIALREAQLELCPDKSAWYCPTSNPPAEEPWTTARSSPQPASKKCEAG